MSNYQYNAAPGPEAGYGYPQQPPAPRGNGLGVAALVVGIVAIVVALIPLLGMVTFFLGPVAVILGVIGLFLKNRKKGMAITGIILGILAVIIAAIWTAALASGVEAVDKSLNEEHKVEYVVTTNGPANVTYWDGSGSSSKDIDKEWAKSFTTDSFSLTTLSVTGDMMNESASVSCEVLIDGESVSKNTGEGSAAMASCSGDTFSGTE